MVARGADDRMMVVGQATMVSSVSRIVFCRFQVELTGISRAEHNIFPHWAASSSPRPVTQQCRCRPSLLHSATSSVGAAVNACSPPRLSLTPAANHALSMPLPKTPIFLRVWLVHQLQRRNTLLHVRQTNNHRRQPGAVTRRMMIHKQLWPIDNERLSPLKENRPTRV